MEAVHGTVQASICKAKKRYMCSRMVHVCVQYSRTIHCVVHSMSSCDYALNADYMNVLKQAH